MRSLGTENKSQGGILKAISVNAESHFKPEGGVQGQRCLWPEASEVRAAGVDGDNHRVGGRRQKEKERWIYQICLPAWQFFSVSAHSCWDILWCVMVLNIERLVLTGCEQIFTRQWALFFLMMSYISLTFHFLPLLHGYSELCTQAFYHFIRLPGPVT